MRIYSFNDRPVNNYMCNKPVGPLDQIHMISVIDQTAEPSDCRVSSDSLLMINESLIKWSSV